MATCIDCGVKVPKGDNCCADCFNEPATAASRQAVTPTSCRTCGKTFTPRDNEDRLWTFCSKECSQKFYSTHYHRARHCLWCAREFSGTAAALFCSPSCRISAHRAGKKAQGNSLKRGSARPPLLRLRFMILERDQFRCTYCGRSPDTGATLQIDHVNPRANGGTWELTNLTTACRECNLGKTDAILSARPPKAP